MATKKGHILGGGAYLDGGEQRFALALVDLDSPSPKAELAPLTFLGHGVVIDPNDPFRAAVFEKKGPGAAIVDLRERRVVQPIPTTSSRRFYGHGAFSADGSLLYATESVVDRDFEGVLVVRDARTLEELGTVPTHGASPHDCQLIDGGKTMVVANGGGPIDSDALPSVTWVDVATNALLDKVVLESPRFNAGHFALTDGGDLAIVSAPRDGLPSMSHQQGALTLRPAGGAPVTVARPKAVVRRMLGETLSVVVHDGIVLATHPLGDCVSMWRMSDQSCLGTLELTAPRGVTTTLDGAWYVVSHVAGKSVRLTAFSTATREPVGFAVDPSFTSGSHVFAWSPER